MSGSSGAWFASTAYAAESTTKLALSVLCPTHSDEAMSGCLRERKATTLGYNFFIYKINVINNMHFKYIPT